MSEFSSNLPISRIQDVLHHRSYSRPALSYRITQPNEVKAAVLLLHGYGEHSRRYQRVMDVWASHNIATLTLDFRGHGLSSGRRGHCEQFSEYFDDANELLTLAKQHVNKVPLFVFGQSFGALVATLWVMRNPDTFRGLLLSSPFFGLQMDVHPVKKAVGRVASRVVPWLSLPSGLKGSEVTRDPEIAKQYDSDPLINSNATARWFTETMAAQEEAFLRAGLIQLPVLVMQGTDDRIANAAKSRAVFDRFRSTDKTFNECKGCFHEVLNEPDVWQEIAVSMAQWVINHSSSS